MSVLLFDGVSFVSATLAVAIDGYLIRSLLSRVIQVVVTLPARISRRGRTLNVDYCNFRYGLRIPFAAPVVCLKRKLEETGQLYMKNEGFYSSNQVHSELRIGPDCVRAD